MEKLRTSDTSGINMTTVNKMEWNRSKKIVYMLQL